MNQMLRLLNPPTVEMPAAVAPVTGHRVVAPRCNHRRADRAGRAPAVVSLTSRPISASTGTRLPRRSTPWSPRAGSRPRRGARSASASIRRCARTSAPARRVARAPEVALRARRAFARLARSGARSLRAALGHPGTRACCLATSCAPRTRACCARAGSTRSTWATSGACRVSARARLVLATSARAHGARAAPHPRSQEAIRARRAGLLGPAKMVVGDPGTRCVDAFRAGRPGSRRYPSTSKGSTSTRWARAARRRCSLSTHAGRHDPTTARFGAAEGRAPGDDAARGRSSSRTTTTTSTTIARAASALGARGAARDLRVDALQGHRPGHPHRLRRRSRCRGRAARSPSSHGDAREQRDHAGRASPRGSRRAASSATCAARGRRTAHGGTRRSRRSRRSRGRDATSRVAFPREDLALWTQWARSTPRASPSGRASAACSSCPRAPCASRRSSGPHGARIAFSRSSPEDLASP